MSLFPEAVPEDMAALCTEGGNEEITDEVNKALAIYDTIEKRSFKASSSVDSLTEQGHMISFDVAFVSEGDILRHFKVTGKALKLPECQLDLEQFGQSLRGYVLSFKDLPEELMQTCHKVTVYSKTAIRVADIVLEPGRMLSNQQPLRLFSRLSGAQAERNPPGFRCHQRHQLPTFQLLQERAAKVLEARVGLSGCVNILS